VNVGIYRNQKQGKRQLGLMINPANHGNYVRAEYEDHNEAMEVALCIGHHPGAQHGRRQQTGRRWLGAGDRRRVSWRAARSRQSRNGEFNGAGAL
jgi:hypothetical protein